MADDELEIPTTIPKKRRQVEAALDKWIAVWLEREDLAPSERRRLEEERNRRKAERRREQNIIGILCPTEGVTPEQVATLEQALVALKPTEIYHHGVDRAVHSRCRATGVAVHVLWHQHKDVVKASDLVVGLVKETTAPNNKTGVWDLVKYAKHRRLPVKVILPSGDELQTEE